MEGLSGEADEWQTFVADVLSLLTSSSLEGRYCSISVKRAEE